MSSNSIYLENIFLRSLANYNGIVKPQVQDVKLADLIKSDALWSWGLDIGKSYLSGIAAASSFYYPTLIHYGRYQTSASTSFSAILINKYQINISGSLRGITQAEIRILAKSLTGYKDEFCDAISRIRLGEVSVCKTGPTRMVDMFVIDVGIVLLVKSMDPSSEELIAQAFLIEYDQMGEDVFLWYQNIEEASECAQLIYNKRGSLLREVEPEVGWSKFFHAKLW